MVRNGTSLVTALMVSLIGCGSSHRLEITFGEGVVVADVAAIDLSIRRGSCAEPGDELFSSTLTRDDAGMGLPDLPRDEPLSFTASAYDSDCRIIAEVCLDSQLPASSDRIELALVPTSGDDCVGGPCPGSCEMPVDAGVQDAPDGDIVADGSLDVIEPLDGGPDAPMEDAGTTPLAAPQVVAPWNGVSTGTALLGSEPSLANDPARPLVRWEESAGAMSYVVEFAECSNEDWTACTFETTFVRIVVDGDARTAEPDGPLDLERTMAPLGARYIFRVGACLMPTGAGCTFAPTRYLNVGRVRQDTDGDGRGDVYAIVRANDGSTLLFSFPTLTTGQRGAAVMTARDPRAVTWIGDYDGDGVGELALVTGDGSDRRVRFIDGGTETGSTDADASTVRWLGDVDGDGFSDFAFVVGSDVRVQLGGATWSAGRSVDVRPPPGVLEHALDISTAGDVDGDGNADLVVMSKSAADMVRLDFYSLASRTPESVGATLTAATGDAGGGFSNQLSITGGLDMDDNGKPEVALGRPRPDRMTVFFDDGRREDASGFGWSASGALAMGLLDGTRRARVVVGASEALDGTLATGSVWHVAFTGDPFAVTRIRFFNQEGFGVAVSTVDAQGDGREDIISLTRTGNSLHVGLFTAADVGGTAVFLFPSGGSFVEIAR